MRALITLVIAATVSVFFTVMAWEDMVQRTESLQQQILIQQKEITQLQKELHTYEDLFVNHRW